MIKIPNTIRIKFFLALVIGLGIASTVNATQNSSSQSAVSFQVFSENAQDENLIRILHETKTYNRVSHIIDQNFILEKPVRLHIQHPKKSQLIATELDQESHVVVLPFSFLHTLYQGLSNKYIHQTTTIEAIFSTTVEFYIWSEFANHLIQEKGLTIEGEQYTARDNFATMMLLNQNTDSSDFITDASEAYLLIHSTHESNINQHSQNELQRDQQRYRHIICLTLGFNETIQQPGLEKDHLKSFSWNKNDMQQCKSSYLTIVRNWYDVIEASLKETNSIRYWLNEKN